MNPSEPESSRARALGVRVELGAKPPRHFRMISLVLLFALIAAVTSATLIGVSPLSFSPALSPVPSATLQSSSSTQPKITWSENHIDVVLSPGESSNKELTFSSSLNMQNIVIEAVPEIAPFLNVQPNSFESVPAGQPQSVRLAFSIPTDATFGIYDGTIHIRFGSQTLPQTLKIVVRVWQVFSSTDLGFSIKYPAGWTPFAPSSDPTKIGFVPAEKELDLFKEYVGDIVAEVFPNPSQLDLDTFYETVATVNLLANSQSFSPLSINGMPAINFINVRGMIPTNVISISKGQLVIEVSDIGQQHDSDGVLHLIASTVR